MNVTEKNRIEAFMDLEDILEFSYPDDIKELKIAIEKLLDEATRYTSDVLNNSKKEKNFFSPFRDDFIVIDTYIEKIENGVILLKERLSLKNYNKDYDYKYIIGKVSVLEDELIPELEEKQSKQKNKNITIFIFIILFSIIFFGYIFTSFY
jgi:hypothetical protein